MNTQSNRPETIREAVATIVQSGHILNKTSYDIAGEILRYVSSDMMLKAKP